MRRSREAAALDRLSAMRMHVPEHVALTVGPSPIVLRWKLRRLGLNPDSEYAQQLLELVDDLGTQRMLQYQPVSTRYVAVEREIKKPRIWG